MIGLYILMIAVVAILCVIVCQNWITAQDLNRIENEILFLNNSMLARKKSNEG